MDKKFNRKYTIPLTHEDYEAMERLAIKRGDDSVAGVFREAVSDYIRKHENPNLLTEQMSVALQENPDIFAPVISAEVQRQLQNELRRLFGERYPR